MSKHKQRPEKLLLYCGHHKAASSWIESIIMNVCADMGFKHGLVDRPSLYNHTYPQPIGYIRNIRSLSDRISVDSLGNFVKEFDIGFLTYTNADFNYLESLNNFDYKGFHVIRDPRDIVVSSYFSHLYSHPTDVWLELTEHREELQKLSKEEGLKLEIDCRHEDFKNMYDWNYNHPNIYELKMENMVANPYQSFLDIFNFLELMDETDLRIINRWFYFIKTSIRRAFLLHLEIDTIPAERLLGIVHQFRFVKSSKGRKPGEENKNSHYRKGQPGDWKNHFNEEHKDYFKEKYGDLLVKLNYEVDNNW